MLILTAPGDRAGSVRLTTPGGRSRTIDVEPGHTVQAYVTDTVKSPNIPWSFVVT